MRKTFFKTLKIQIPKSARVLDLGSYDGKKNKWMIKEGYQYQGLDLLQENEYVKKVDFVAWLENNKTLFDLILAEFSLQQIPKDDFWKTINNIQESLSLGGYLYISSFNEKDKFGPLFTNAEFLKIGDGFNILYQKNSISKDLKKRNRYITSMLLQKTR